MKMNPDYTFIYGLTDPRTNAIRYIGKSDNPRQRLKSHITEHNESSSPKALWIRDLWNLGLRPGIRIIMKVPYSQWEYFERQTIECYGGLKELLNLVPGGNQPGAPWDEYHRANHHRAMKNTSAKMSVRLKELWTDPNHRACVAEGMRRAKLEGKYEVRPDERERRSEKLIDSWSDSEFRISRTESMIEAWDNQERRDNLSERNRKNWKSPEYREKTIQQFKEYASSPDNLQRLSELNHQRWADPEEHCRQSERAIERWANPEERHRQSERMKQACANPELRQKRSQNAKRMWADPQYREIMCQKCREREQRKREQRLGPKDNED